MPQALGSTFLKMTYQPTATLLNVEFWLRTRTQGYQAQEKLRNLSFQEEPGVRVDTHIYPQFIISHEYDPMIAKIIVHGTDRQHAISRMLGALKELTIEGISTNRDTLISILRQDWFKNQNIHTHSLTNNMEKLKYEITS